MSYDFFKFISVNDSDYSVSEFENIMNDFSKNKNYKFLSHKFFDSFLKKMNEENDLKMTRSFIIKFILKNPKELNNDEINAKAIQFLCRGDLIGELTSENILGVLEIAIGFTICAASEFSQMGYIAGSSLICHGTSKILGYEYQNMRIDFNF
jgi:hypothetical protein